MCLLLELPLPRPFLLRLLTVLTRQTRQAVDPINQSIFLDIYGYDTNRAKVAGVKVYLR
jgi:hypothetical protein